MNKTTYSPKATVTALAGLTLMLGVGTAAAKVDNSLWLSPKPAPAASQACNLHQPQPPSRDARPTRQARKKPGRFESEHWPKPVRTYYLNKPVSSNAKAFFLRADGSFLELEVMADGPQAVITVKTPFKNEQLHGANYIYVIDKEVKDNILEVRVAKWLTIHHSCSWGHDFRNNPKRLTASPLSQAPIDIVVNGLYNSNFHAETHTGNILPIKFFANGKL